MIRQLNVSRPRRSRAGLCLIGLCSLVPFLVPNFCNGQNSGRYQSIVTNNDMVPGSTDTFTFLDEAVISRNGEWIVFEGDYTGPVGRGIFRYSTATGTLNQIIAKDDALAGGTFNFGFGGRNLSVNNSGTVAFMGAISGTGATNNDSGIFSGTGGVITTLALEGNAAPGGAGGTFGNFGTGISDIQFRGINDLGQAFVRDSVSDSPGGLTDDQRQYRLSASPAIAAITEGDAAPGGGFYNAIGFAEMNDVGEAVVAGSTIVANIGSKIWFVDSGGTVSELATWSTSGGTATAVGTILSSSSNFSLNNAGDVVFSGGTSIAQNGTADSHLFKTSKAGGTPVAILSEDTATPDGNGVFANFVNLAPRLNDAGQYASGMALKNTSGGISDDSGIYRVDPNGDVVKIFREGDAALSGVGTFGQLNGTRSFAFNNYGVVALQTDYVGTSDSEVIVVSDGIDSFEVAREGDIVGGNTVLGMEFSNGLYGNDRSNSGLDDYGRVAFRMSLTGGGRAIRLWTPDLHHRGGNSDFGDNTKWTLSLGPDHVHDVFIDSDTDSVVTANGTHTVRNLQVGGGTGMVTLAFADNASINVVEDFNVVENGNIQMGANSFLDVAILSGSGTISGDITSSISVEQLLNPGQSPGQLEFAGDLTLESTSTTLIELGGILEGEFDAITGLDSLMLGGDLVVELYDGFVLADGMQFDIFDTLGSTTGQFNGLANGDLVGNFGGTDLFISYDNSPGGGVSLSTTAIPEPTGIVILGMLAGLAFTQRRRS